MAKKIRAILYFLIFYSGLVYLFRFIYRKIYNNPIKILYAHRIIDQSDDLYGFLKELGHFDTEEFEKKIRYLLRHYRVISLDECIAYLRTKKRPPNCVVLTFDDGYKSIYTKAFPILKKYKIPATIFLTVDFISNKKIIWYDKLTYIIGKTNVDSFTIPEILGKRFACSIIQDKKDSHRALNKFLKSIDDQEKEGILDRLKCLLKVKETDLTYLNLSLSWEEIKEMRDSNLITFGSHTMLHPILTNVTFDRLERELKQSKAIISDNLGNPVNFFAYPAGAYNQKIREKVKTLGYKAAFSTLPGGNTENTDPFLLKRDGFVHESFVMFALNMAGFFELTKQEVKSEQNEITISKRSDENSEIQQWLPYYFFINFFPRKGRNLNLPLHIMICIVDHFEPFHGVTDIREAESKVKIWVEAYPRLAANYRDSDDMKPKHTWFYPPHHDLKFLKDLVDLCKQGFGEIELHLHHNQIPPFPDTPETLRFKIFQAIEKYSEFGIFCLPNGSKRFAFIHGDWSLDNSKGKQYCGVNNEIDILKECGCYADFTFPSLGKTQPAFVNRIYYAKDNPNKPKSYNWGKEVKAGGKPRNELIIIPGIIGLRWGKNGNNKFIPLIESSNIDESDYICPARIDYWIKNAITINGKPNWLFIKLHTHGVKTEQFNSIFGKSAQCLYNYLVNRYNDKDRYYFHFVTAREMYNIVKAAEAGEQGNPNDYREYEIPKYTYLK
jgi:peptidoglycan/xylan/chitin deacetylase (PgdA/CDA1 family)